MSRPRVLVAGAFGQHNPGDEAVLDAVILGLDGCEVMATAPAGSPVRFGRPYRAVAPSPPLAVASAAMGADLVVATATVFKTLHPASGRRRHGLLLNTLGLALGARAVGRPMEMVGVGVGQLEDRWAKLLARGVVSTAGTVQVRDEESAGLLHAAGIRHGVTLGADVAWTLFPAEAEPRPAAARPRRVVVALSHLAGGPELPATVAGALNGLAADGFSVALQPWQPEQDLPLAEEISARLSRPAVIEPAPEGLEDAAASFADAGLVLGLRFHSLVTAGAAGVPFVALGHEPKLIGMARRLAQPVVDPGVDAATLETAARAAWAGPGPSAAAVADQQGVAAETLTRLRALAFARADGRAVGARERRQGRAA